jgi:tol-pal system protein YbgF
MHSSVGKMFVACGLVILTGPLCFMTWAQTYVDLEAERAAAQAAGRSTGSSSSRPTTNTGTNANASVPADPYAARPAQAYPATSYGVNNAPSAPAAMESTPESSPVRTSASGSTAAPTSGAGSQMAGSDQGRLYLQLQQLQEEVRRLNGKLEEQAYELTTLKEQSLQRYIDLDKRIGGAAATSTTPPVGGPAVATSKPVAGGPTEAINAANPPVTAPAASRSAPAAAQPGEANAYGAAYALVQGRKFDQAIPAFQQFLQRYPDGEYAANAHYWLGELYLVKEPPDLEASRQSFALLLSQYPDNSKAPDALYKLGKVQFLKGNREKAREYLDQVIKLYGSTNNASVKLARDFIAQNY